jgi:hypothetical protein
LTQRSAAPPDRPACAWATEVGKTHVREPTRDHTAAAKGLEQQRFETGRGLGERVRGRALKSISKPDSVASGACRCFAR